MLRTGGLHSPCESLTPRFDAQVSPYAGGLLVSRGWCACLGGVRSPFRGPQPASLDHVPSPAPIIPDVGFTPVRLEDRVLPCQQVPSRWTRALSATSTCSPGFPVCSCLRLRSGTGLIKAPNSLSAVRRPSLFPGHPSQRPFAPAGLCCPHHHRYYGLIRPTRRLPPTSRFITGYGVGLCPPKSSGLPTSGSLLWVCVPFLRAAIHTPGGELVTSPQLFANSTGLPRLHTGSAPPIPRHRLLPSQDHDAATFALCYGPQDCSPPCADPTQVALADGDFYTPAFPESVALP
jgi:hypothetical protein